MTNFRNFLVTHAVRVYGLIVAVFALVAYYLPGLPSDLVLGVVAAALALFGGEVTQRVEDGKTADAAEFAAREAEGSL